MRNIISISVLALFIGAAPVLAQGSSTGAKAGRAVGGAAQEAGKYTDDALITSHIKQQFLADSLVQGRHISVTTKDHVVSLTGTVQSEAAHDRALSIAQNTNGVASVTDNLKVTPSK